MSEVILALAVAAMAGGFLYLKKKMEKAMSGDAWVSRIRDEIDELVLEMNQTAERNVALLENRVKALEGLLEEADKRLLLLQKETEKSDLSRQVYTHLKKNIPLPPEEGDHPVRQGPPPPAEERRTPPPEKAPSLKDQVMNLYGQGFSADIISQKLKTTIAEVDLIISLQTEGADS